MHTCAHTNISTAIFQRNISQPASCIDSFFNKEVFIQEPVRFQDLMEQKSMDLVTNRCPRAVTYMNLSNQFLPSLRNKSILNLFLYYSEYEE